MPLVGTYLHCLQKQKKNIEFSKPTSYNFKFMGYLLKKKKKKKKKKKTGT